MGRLQFVSYDGKWPRLRRGTLIMMLDGEEVIFPENCLYCVEHDPLNTGLGMWVIRLYPVNFPEELKEYAEDLVNSNVPPDYPYYWD